jgi:hypothetical protein
MSFFVVHEYYELDQILLFSRYANKFINYEISLEYIFKKNQKKTSLLFDQVKFVYRTYRIAIVLEMINFLIGI